MSGVISTIIELQPRISAAGRNHKHLSGRHRTGPASPFTHSIFLRTFLWTSFISTSLSTRYWLLEDPTDWGILYLWHRGTPLTGFEHLWILGLAVCAILGSFLLAPSAQGGLELPIPWSGTSLCLPEACISQRVLGMPCPGCGLSRSFVALSAGDVTSACRFHPLGPLVYLLCWLQIPYRIGEYLGASKSWRFWAQANEWLHLVTWGLVFALFFAWVVRIVVL